MSFGRPMIMSELDAAIANGHPLWGKPGVHQGDRGLVWTCSMRDGSVSLACATPDGLLAAIEGIDRTDVWPGVQRAIDDEQAELRRAGLDRKGQP